jgi:hypothetical protein
MDLNIEIEDGRIVTLLYAKPMALYLYIPPNSSHAPGILTGLVYGQVLQVYQLCLQSKDINTKLAAFYRQLRVRGYHPRQLLLLFKKAINNACTYLSCMDDEQRFIAKEKKDASKQRVFFHLPFHPQLPPSAEIQCIWHSNVSFPRGEPMLHHLKNHEGHCIPMKQMIVAYCRDLNLGNLLSYRKLCQRKGPKVSLYWNTSRDD